MGFQGPSLSPLSPSQASRAGKVSGVHVVPERESLHMFQGQREGLLLPKGEEEGGAWKGVTFEISSLHSPGMGTPKDLSSAPWLCVFGQVTVLL